MEYMELLLRKDINIIGRNLEVFSNGEVYAKPFTKTDGRKMKRRKFKPSINGNKRLGFQLICGDQQRYITIHRLLAECFLENTEDKPQVDHINGNPLDNRLSNLRWVTVKENSRAYNKNQRGSFSKYRGVTFDAKKWRARIRHDDLLMQIGSFDTELEAAIAWNKKALELGWFKECLNQV